MLIDWTQFVGILSLGLSPDTGSSVTQTAERERLNYFIEVYEREYLMNVLGSSLYRRFMEYLDSEEEDSEPILSELCNLLAQKYSPIACYIYFKIISVGNSHVTRVGTVTSADDEAVSPYTRQVMVWNDMVTRNEEIRELLSDVPDFKPDETMFQRINVMCL